MIPKIIFGNNLTAGKKTKFSQRLIFHAIGAEPLDEFVDSAHATRSFASGLL